MIIRVRMIPDALHDEEAGPARVLLVQLDDGAFSVLVEVRPGVAVAPRGVAVRLVLEVNRKKVPEALGGLVGIGRVKTGVRAGMHVPPVKSFTCIIKLYKQLCIADRDIAPTS